MPGRENGRPQRIDRRWLVGSLRDSLQSQWSLVGGANRYEPESIAARLPGAWGLVSMIAEDDGRLRVVSGVALDCLAALKPFPRASPEVVPSYTQLNDSEKCLMDVEGSDLRIVRVVSSSPEAQLPRSESIRQFLGDLVDRIEGHARERDILDSRLARMHRGEPGASSNIYRLRQTLLLAHRVGTPSEVDRLNKAIGDEKVLILASIIESGDATGYEEMLHEAGTPVEELDNKAAYPLPFANGAEPDAATRRMLEFLLTADGREMMEAYLAEVAGDPHQYGFDNAATATDAELAEGLRLFLGVVSESGLPNLAIANLVQTESIDWFTVLLASKSV